jgi:hypothetical protein
VAYNPPVLKDAKLNAGAAKINAESGEIVSESSRRRRRPPIAQSRVLGQIRLVFRSAKRSNGGLFPPLAETDRVRAGWSCRIVATPFAQVRVLGRFVAYSVS